MQRPSLQSTSATLQSLSHGQNAWFWFNSGIERTEVPLLVSPVGDDPGMTRLVSWVNGIRIPDASTEWTGLLHVDETGRLRFGSETASEDLLHRLAQWCRQHAEAHPGLSRLVEASVIQYDDERRVRAIWDDPQAWEGIPAPEIPGVLADTVATLERVTPGDACWFWVSPNGPGGIPHLALTPQSSDPSASDFAARAKRLVLRSLEPVDGVWGDFRVLGTGKLVFNSTGDADTLTEVLAALATRPDLARLAGAVVMERGAAGFLSGQVVVPHDYTDEAQLIASLGPKEELFFWLTPRGSDFTPTLRLSKDRDRLREAAKAARGQGAMKSGRVLLGDDGRLVFHCRDPYPEFLPSLARWTATYHPGWPALARLKYARLVVRDQDGAIRGTLSRDRLWRLAGEG